MKRVWLINQWLPPNVAPTGVLMAQLAQALIDRGFAVTALCRSAASPGNEAPYVEVIERVPNTPRRLLDKLSAWPRFAHAVLGHLRARVAAGDVIVVSSDPPLFFGHVIALAQQRGAKAIHWSQDVYPEVLAAYQPWLRWPLAPLKWWRNRALRGAAATVVISEGMAQRLTRSRGRLVTIANWPTHTHPDSVASIPPGSRHDDQELVIGYSGNLGRVHEFGTLVAAAARLLPEHRVRFFITGEGPRLAELKAAVVHHGVEARFEFAAPVPASGLARILAASDVHFVSLQACFDGLVLPSKLYGIAAAKRPILFCGAARGEVAALIAASEAGLSVAQGDSSALLDAILRLRDPALRQRYAEGAQRMLASQGTRAEALHRWTSLIEAIARTN